MSKRAEAMRKAARDRVAAQQALEKAGAKLVTFNNVTLSVLAKDEHEAYAKLCTLLQLGSLWLLEYTTDTFTVQSAGSDGSASPPPDVEQSTTLLWPQ